MKFINRKSELETLESQYKNADSSFAVIYGRRRTGKTTLIKEFIKNKKQAIYFLADIENEHVQIKRLMELCAQTFEEPLFEQLEAHWDAFIECFLKTVDFKKQKIVFVIDEFQYLVKANKAAPSIFQRIWDEKLKSKNIMLILCGSLVSMMYESTLSYKSPLYGRRTCQIRLQPMSFSNYKKFFPGKKSEDIIKFYALTGGVPKYIESINPDINLFRNITQFVLNKNTPLYIEPKFILKEELTDTITYFSILRIISQGERKIGKIAARLGIEAKNLTSFLDKLRELDIIERKIPITETAPEKSRKGLYFIKDNYFSFWFRFVFPYLSYLEIDRTSYVESIIKRDFDKFVSHIFEDISQEITLLTTLPFPILKIGKWWDKDNEIDLVALGENEIIFGECKWSNSKIGLNILNDLKEKSKYVEWRNQTRKEYYALYSKSGFTSDLSIHAKKETNIFLFSLKDFK